MESLINLWIKINILGFGAEIDEFELENELAQLEQEALAKEISQLDIPSVPNDPIPNHRQPVATTSNARKNDELTALENWAASNW